jgi:hypothetical protein
MIKLTNILAEMRLNEPGLGRLPSNIRELFSKLFSSEYDFSYDASDPMEPVTLNTIAIEDYIPEDFIDDNTGEIYDKGLYYMSSKDRWDYRHKFDEKDTATMLAFINKYPNGMNFVSRIFHHTIPKAPGAPLNYYDECTKYSRYSREGYDNIYISILCPNLDIDGNIFTGWFDQNGKYYFDSEHFTEYGERK